MRRQRDKRHASNHYSRKSPFSLVCAPILLEPEAPVMAPCWNQRVFGGAVHPRCSSRSRCCSVRVSQINGCAFCVEINSSLVLKRGGGLDKLEEIDRFEERARFTEREKAALAYAEAVTYSDRKPTAEHFTRLRRHFNDDAIIELTGLIAFQNLSSKFNAALSVEAQGFCVAPPRCG